MKKTLVVVAVAAVALVALTGFGPHGRGPFHGDPQKLGKFLTWKINDTLDDLGATEAQRAQILAIKDRVFAQAAPMHEARRADRDELRAQWLSEQPDAQRIHALIDQRAESARAFAHQAADALIEVHGVLTPEQRRQLAEQLEQMGPPEP